MRKLAALVLLFSGIVLLGGTAAATIQSTFNNVTVSTQVNSDLAITGWAVYVDSKLYYAGNGSDNSNISVVCATVSNSTQRLCGFTATIPIPTGTHNVVIRAWDSKGEYASSSVSVSR
jgi:hypothetical protein